MKEVLSPAGSMEALQAAIKNGANAVYLGLPEFSARAGADNFTPEQTKVAVEKVAGRCETESSVGITLDNLRDYAEAGVDFISVGALTHQIKSLDMSLKAC